MQQIYYIHNNGGRPFKVILTKKKILIYEDELNNYKDLLYELDNKKDAVFIGTSPASPRTRFSGGFSPKEDGNTILVHLGKKEYFFIGPAVIFKFKALSKITTFISLVGNSDIIYPYAIDDQGNIYLLIEDVILKRNTEIKKDLTNFADPYKYYYRHSLITADKSYLKPHRPKHSFENIQKFFIDDKEFTLTYNPRPAKDYDRLIPEWGKQLWYQKKNEASRKLLTRSHYIALMKKFGRLNSFQCLRTYARYCQD